MNERDIDKAERIAQFVLLSIFTLLATIIAMTFGFASALITVAFMILRTSFTLTISIVDEIIIRKEMYHATQRRGQSRI